MIFDQIDQLKREYTDKYVIVEGARPELARFDGQTGVVKTVNMNGRALVEFDANNNIGWYDIALDYLRVIDKPLEKTEKKVEKEAPAKSEKPAAKAAPAGEKKLSALEMARAQGAAKAGGAAATAKPAAAKPAAPAAGGATKPSTADILAAARAKKGEAPTSSAAPVEAAPAPAAKAPPAAKPAKPAGGPPADISVKSSTADKIAWCRVHDAQG